MSSPDATRPALRLDKLRITFHAGTPDERVALDDLSLTLAEGDFTVVIGSNGAGKSTMLNVISGALQPDGGRVELHGHDVTHLSVHRRAAYIGRVFQDPMLGTAPSLSIEENLALAERRGQRRGLRLALGAANRKRYADLLAPFGLGLESRMRVLAGKLSGGQRQVLALLMASLRKPRLLLLDEHTAALDPGTAELVMRATRRIVDDDRLTVLMITHNMQQAIDFGNRLIALNAGRVRVDLHGEDKTGLTVDSLVRRFAGASDEHLLRA
ncbi:MAG: ATP-binding cassette domain-containing protein [Pigmentiphaga sp.]|nr:ATP-binding cassette domain-containing protein [Pigmentiphaga sp.]